MTDERRDAETPGGMGEPLADGSPEPELATPFDTRYAARPKRRRWGIVAGVALAAVLGLLLVTDIVTSSPAVCGSCHEMGVRTSEWAQSAHAGVGCVDCHVGSREWYEFPVSAVEQTMLLGRDTFLHFSGGFDDPVDRRGPGVAPMADAICLQCHDPERKATSGFRILIDHPEHARRNGSCVSCHERTAHPLPTRSRPISLMAQCMNCHGSAEQPEASAECGVCHPSGYELRPASHTRSRWAKGHGRIATEDQRQCSLCHKKDFCTDCHGLEMPHPADWEQGAQGHGPASRADRELCTKCHAEQPDMCAMCHHKGIDPAKGSWVKQHFVQVEQKGAAFCFDCHSPTYCVRCHVGRKPDQGGI